MKKIYQDIANRIFERGACKFGAFKLKLHEKNPEAPLSPFYFNLRTPENPKPGPLLEEDCDLIAEGFDEVMREYYVSADSVAGIPNAADPLVDAFLRLMRNGKNYRLVKLSKVVTEEGRRIVPMPGFEYKPGERVIVFDDLITKADSKIEAIKAIESGGAVVVLVVVALDREQGGKEQLEKAGYTVLVCIKVSDLFAYYRDTERISEEKYVECMEYIRNN